VLELCKSGPAVEGRELRQIGVGSRTPMLVDGDPARDRVRPGAEMLAVTQLGLRTKGAEERLLKRVLYAIASVSADEETDDLLAVLFVEALEGRQAHPRHLETQEGPQV